MENGLIRTVIEFKERHKRIIREDKETFRYFEIIKK